MTSWRLLLRVALATLVARTAPCAVPGAAPGIAPWQAKHAAGSRLPGGYTPLHEGHVDAGTGLYVREDEDLVLPAAPSFVLRRTYRTKDTRSRAFGVGASHTGDWYLVGDSARFQWGDLILEDGGRIHYERVSKGTGISNARYEHWKTPSSFYGSALAWTGADWMLRRRDGVILTFRACSPATGACGLTSITDAGGRIIRFLRSGSGRLMRIVAGAQWIAFDYRNGGRISRARDHAGHVVEYGYDESGRLRRSIASDGTNRSYEYDDRGRLIRVEEPGRVVENRYDAADMCVWQRVTRPADPAHGAQARGEPYIFQFAYVMTGGRVRQSETRESDGSSHRRVYTTLGYLESETYDFDTDYAKTIRYQRDARTGLVSRLAFACSGGSRPRKPRTLPATPATEPRVKAALLTTSCRSARR